MSRRLLIGFTSALLAVALASAAHADNPTMIGGGGSALVRGGAPLPQFNTSFPIQIGNPDPVGAAKRDLQISLTAPDHSVLSFLFSPRSLAFETPSIGGSAGVDYAGLAWNLFDYNRLSGSVAFSSAINRQGNLDPTSRLYGPLISLHSTFELGYSLAPRQSLSFDLDRAMPAPYLGDRSVPAENLRLQYGYRF